MYGDPRSSNALLPSAYPFSCCMCWDNANTFQSHPLFTTTTTTTATKAAMCCSQTDSNPQEVLFARALDMCVCPQMPVCGLHEAPTPSPESPRTPAASAASSNACTGPLLLQQKRRVDGHQPPCAPQLLLPLCRWAAAQRLPPWLFCVLPVCFPCSKSSMLSWISKQSRDQGAATVGVVLSNRLEMLETLDHAATDAC